MARAVRSASLNFGLVTVPVELYSAIREHTTHFPRLERAAADRVRIQRVDERGRRSARAGRETGSGAWATARIWAPSWPPIAS